MKHLIKVMLILGAIFASAFVVGRLAGILTVDKVQRWLEVAQSADPKWVVGTVVLLLFLDLVVAVPTLAITILAGYFLGFPAGAATAVLGMTSAAFSGYWISRRWGQRGIALLVRDETDRQELVETFHKSGPAMIILSRAAPMVPEVTACMAGATRMHFVGYCLFFAISTLPYALIAAYAGSVSSLDSPQPAIYAVLSLYLVLWSGWFLFQRRNRRKVVA